MVMGGSPALHKKFSAPASRAHPLACRRFSLQTSKSGSQWIQEDQQDPNRRMSHFKESMGKSWGRFKSIMGIKSNAMGTLTLPRKEPLRLEEAQTCEHCTTELTGRPLASMTQRISYRCVQYGSESPIFLREVPPCRRCGKTQDFSLYTFEASVRDIAKVQKLMAMHKDVDWLSEFSRIDVEKSPGRCTIKSNSIHTLKSIPTL